MTTLGRLNRIDAGITNISNTSTKTLGRLNRIDIAKPQIQQQVKIEAPKVEIKTPVQVQQPKQNILQKVSSFVGNLLQKSAARQQVEEKLNQPTPTFNKPTEVKSQKLITQPTISGVPAQQTPEVKAKADKQAGLGLEKLKTFNDKSKVVLKEIAKRTSGTGILATIKSASPQVTFKQAYEVARKSQQEKDNTLPEKFITGLKDTVPQTALGIILGFVPFVGPGLATSYWAAVSAGSEIEEKGYATPSNVAIDVIGDRILGGMMEKLFKTPAKSLLKIIKKSFVTEGSTEVSQDLLKFGNDYRLAKTKEERNAVVDKAKNYFTSGQILLTAGIGGITGAGVGGVVGTLSNLQKKQGVNTFSPNDVEDSLLNSTLLDTEESSKVQDIIKQARDNNSQLIVDSDGTGNIVVTTPEGDKVGISLVKTEQPILTEEQRRMNALNLSRGFGEVKTEQPRQLTAPDSLLVSHEGAPDKVIVEEYKTKIQNGETIEPVKVIREGTKYGIEDGKHRFQAYKELGIKDIPIEIVPGVSAKPREIISKPEKIIYEKTLIKSKLGLGVKEKAVSTVNTKRLKEKIGNYFTDLPEYNKVKVNEQSEMSSQIVVDNLDNAMDIALGKTDAPEGVLPESVFIAVEENARRTGDIETLRKLATESALIPEATLMGQRIRMLRERNKNSPVKVMQDIVKAKEEQFKKKYAGKSKDEITKKEVKSLKEKIKKPDRYDWSKFLDSIRC